MASMTFINLSAPVQQVTPYSTIMNTREFSYSLRYQLQGNFIDFLPYHNIIILNLCTMNWQYCFVGVFCLVCGDCCGIYLVFLLQQDFCSKNKTNKKCTKLLYSILHPPPPTPYPTIRQSNYTAIFPPQKCLIY